MKNWNQIKAIVLTMLGINSLPQKDGKLDLSDDQVAILKKHLDESQIQAINDSANAAFENERRIAQLREENQDTYKQLIKLLKDNDIEAAEDEEQDVEASEEGGGEKETKPSTRALINALQATLKGNKTLIEKLSADPESELAELINSKINGMKHSDTHLFASGNQWDAYENRPWNKRAAGLQEVGAATFSEVDVDQIKSDFGDYFKKDLNKRVSFLRGLSRLPDFWERLSGVQDQAWYINLFVGDVSQARKKKWLPKGKFTIQPERAKVFDIQIDLEFNGNDLQKLEKTWLGRLNEEGASPFKMSFVAYLMNEVMKKRVEEDEIALIKGAFFPTDDDATSPGSYLHKCNGLLKLIQVAQKERKYLTYDLGTPTQANIYDYVENLVKSVPKYWRDLPGMALYMDPDWEKAYHKKREELKGTMPTYVPGKMTVDRYDNIRIVPLYGDIGDLMFITPDDNIATLEGKPGEENLFQFEKAKRDLAVYADYRIGVHVYAFGYKWPVGTEMTDASQIFFSNDVEIVLNNYIPIEPGATTPDAQYHNELQVGINAGATAITNILNVSDGEYVYLYGNGTVNASTIANGGNFDLAGNITLKENVMIKLYKRADDGKFVEILRNENLLKPEFVVLDADATTADAANGTRFVTSDNTQATELTDILNAIENEKYRIEGGSNADSTTIAKTGKFSRISAAITLADGNWIDVIYQSGKFVELGRSVA